ncbi:hypothetical protein [Thiopseudomonas denitrificans]|uniref:Uncharacterized protein n=1 Tax=Thiopseudomonas denitrificans TaxID=1501432 RepID=A0A4R6TUY1_9GAMM|nr:hypothetical protein [Thiopseudomonas denitrificans]TDQ37570.1 hypothetical protein DFQ45_10775 [Thiopseudomonas denitrificans]
MSRSSFTRLRAAFARLFSRNRRPANQYEPPRYPDDEEEAQGADSETRGEFYCIMLRDGTCRSGYIIDEPEPAEGKDV